MADNKKRLEPHFDNGHMVPTSGKFNLAKVDTSPPKGERDEDELEEKLEKEVEKIAKLQRVLYASDRHAVLLVFQAMDAAGKDSTIRAVTSGVNPAGFQVHSFKAPSSNELDQDFLWRSARRLPQRGRIGIFNRSYYEEVLVVRVHPEYLGGQRLPETPPLKDLWKERFESIADHEKHLARNGTVVLKFFLNVSREEQCARFLSRIDEPKKNWKFNPGDVKERARWDDYMEAYADALEATSKPWAPWYAIPADSKPYMRYIVARTLRKTLENLALEYPTVSDDERAQMLQLRDELAGDQ